MDNIGNNHKGVESQANQQINNIKKSLLKTTKGIKSTQETFEKIAHFYKRRRKLDETVNNTNKKGG